MGVIYDNESSNIADIKERRNIKNEDVLNDVINVLSSQIGSLTNPSRLTDIINDRYAKGVNKKENEYIINYEKLNIIKGQTINSEETKTIYTVENGVLNYYFEDDINRVIKEKTLNLLSKGSLISMFLTRQLHDALYDEINNNAKYENGNEYSKNCLHRKILSKQKCNTTSI